MAARNPVTRWVVPFLAGVVITVVLACSAASGPPAGGTTSPGDDAGGSASDPGIGGSSGGSSGGATTGRSSGAGSTGSSSGASSGGRPDAPSSSSGDAGAVNARCGVSGMCDPHRCTVCVPADGGLDAAICATGTTAVCGKNQATFHCGSQADCASGESCCGAYDLNGLTLTTSCHAGACPAAAPLCGTGSQCQLCKTTQECHAGSCVKQICNGNEVHFCSQNLFCTPAP